MTTAGGGHRKRKTVKRGVGGFLRGAPLNIYPDWSGLGMQCTGAAWMAEGSRKCGAKSEASAGFLLRTGSDSVVHNPP